MQNSNTSAHIVANFVSQEALANNIGIAFDPDFASMNLRLPGYENGTPEHEWMGVGNERSDRIEEFWNEMIGMMNVPPLSPLVLDLDGDGIELTSLDGSSAYFDLDIDGFAQLAGRVAADDGLLALDTNDDGIINDGSELFGDQTGYEQGFLALAAHDLNADGVIDSNDAVFRGMVPGAESYR